MERKKFLGNALKFIRSRMKFFHQPSAISLQPYLFLALAIWGCGVAGAVDRANLTFYLPFEGSLQPEIAGAPAATPGGANTQLKFIKGTAQDAQLVAGRRGQGLKVTPDLNLQYLTRESFSAREGTIAFWMEPVGWSGVGHFRHFLVAHADGVAMDFYMYYGNPWWYLANGTRYDLVGGSNWPSAFEKGEGFPEGKWTFIAGTYKPGQQTYYINGKLIIRRTDGLIEPEFINTGILEIPPGDQVLDEIMIFDRVLTEQEIRAVYLANMPDR